MWDWSLLKQPPPAQPASWTTKWAQTFYDVSRAASVLIIATCILSMAVVALLSYGRRRQKVKVLQQVEPLSTFASKEDAPTTVESSPPKILLERAPAPRKRNKFRSDPKTDGATFLFLEGGGVEAISQLLQLEAILLGVKEKRKLSEAPLPCEFFDMICGVGMGGVIAILLGRLGMNVETAIECFNRFSVAVFANQDSTGCFSVATFEETFRVLLAEYGLDASESLYDEVYASDCRTLIYATPSAHANSIRAFRSYENTTDATRSTIMETARATTALPGLFSPALVGPPHMQESFSGWVSCANPMEEMLREAEEVYGPDQLVSLTLGIGTGKEAVISIDSTMGQMKTLAQLNEALRSLATSAEATARSLDYRLSGLNIYKRLNVDAGVERGSESTVATPKTMGDFRSHTLAYLQKRRVKQVLDDTISILCTRRGRATISSINHARGITVSSKPLPIVSFEFVMRVDIWIALMRACFDGEGRLRTGQQIRVALFGPGGGGKSQIMAKFCHEFATEFSDILFIDASSESSIQSDLVAFLLTKDGVSKDATWSDALAWLAASPGWLLVLDSADNVEFNLSTYIPACQHGCVAITSRGREVEQFVPAGHGIHVESMKEDEAVKLLLYAARIARDDSTVAIAKQIAHALGCFPLALATTGGYIFASGDLEGFLDIYSEHRVRLLRDYQPGSRQLDKHHQTTYVTWDMSFNLLPPQVQSFLQICAFLYSSGILRTMFTRGASANFSSTSANYFGRPPDLQEYIDLLTRALFEGDTWDEYYFDTRIIAPIMSTSFFSMLRTRGGVAYNMHSLIQTYCRDRLDADSQVIFARAATHLVTATLSGKPSPDAAEHTFICNMAPQLRHLSTEHIGLGALYVGFMSLRAAGFGHDALRYCEVFQGRCVEALGPNDRRTLAAKSNKAAILHDLGRFHEAVVIVQEVAQAQLQRFGPLHPDTLTSLNNLGSMFTQLGRYADAESAQTAVFQARIQLLGESHPATLASMNSLGLTLGRLGKYTEAEVLYRKALGFRIELLGPTNNETTATMSNLATVLDQLGRYAEAKTVHRQVVEIREQVLGPTHQDTLTAKNNLSVTLLKLQRYHEAEAIQREIIDVCKSTLGPSHPATISYMSNLASTLRAMARITDAEVLFREVVNLARQTFGPVHPQTGTFLQNWGMTLAELGEHLQAERAFRDAFNIRKEALGWMHLDTLKTMNDWASQIEMVGLRNAATEFRRIVLRGRKQLLGLKHGETLIAMHNLAMNLGEGEEAVELERLALESAMEVHGREHPDTQLFEKSLQEMLERTRL